MGGVIDDEDKFDSAIIAKYGKETIFDPKDSWTPEKEQDFLKQSKELAEREKQYLSKKQRIGYKGFYVSKALLSKIKKDRVCQLCKQYSFDFRDDFYQEKYKCCWICYIKHFEVSK